MVSLIYARGWHVITAMVLTLSLILVLPAGQTSAAAITHQVTNVGDKSFTVAWVTDSAEAGYLSYGTSPASLSSTAYDDRGQATEDDTHYVTITGLTAGTTYYYEIVSGGTTYNNGGALYEITTGPGLDFAMPDMIIGKAYKADGATAAEGAIIYASIGTSQVLSALADSRGSWGLNIAPIRTANHQDYYTYSDSDTVSLDALGGADGKTTQTVSLAVVRAGPPATNLTLGTAAGLNGSETEPDESQAAQPTDTVNEDTAPLPSNIPAVFSLSNLTIQPAEVQAGDTVTITASLANAGGSAGSHAVVLKIDGVKEADISMTVAAGQSRTVNFTVSKQRVATHTVSVNDLRGSFTVVAPPTQNNLPVVGAIFGGAIVIALLIYLFRSRRRAC